MWLSQDVVALHLSDLNGDKAANETAAVREHWAKNVKAPAEAAGKRVPRLVMQESPYRSFTEPILAEIDKLEHEFPSRTIAVILPELVERHWWNIVLHRRRATQLRWALMQRGDQRMVVIGVPWYLKD